MLVGKEKLGSSRIKFSRRYKSGEAGSCHLTCWHMAAEHTEYQYPIKDHRLPEVPSDVSISVYPQARV